MNITIIGKGNVGGGLAKLWQNAGHAVNPLGREGGDGSAADVVVVAVPSGAIADALGKVSGIDGKVTIDATNAYGPRNERAVRIARARSEIDRGRADGQVVQPQLRRALRRDWQPACAAEQPQVV